MGSATHKLWRCFQACAVENTVMLALKGIQDALLGDVELAGEVGVLIAETTRCDYLQRGGGRCPAHHYFLLAYFVLSRLTTFFYIRQKWGALLGVCSSI